MTGQGQPMDVIEESAETRSGADEAATPPVRATRSAQRRRAAKATPVISDPVAEDAAPAAASESIVPVIAEPAAVPPEPLSTPTAAEPADNHAEDRIMDYADTATDTTEQMADAGQAMASDMTGRAQDAMAKGSKMLEEINAFGKGNVEALVESSKIAAKGIETLGQEAAEFTRKSFEGATAAMRTLATTRSPAEFMKLQGDYMRSMFDAMVAETSKSTELVLKLANDVAQPISNRVALAAEKVKAAA